ncbi:N-acetylmuramidase domain-containing protein [Rhodobaculum claviforme]|uniref:DUF3380 domain-containing protein n=1 Tax=Rhodobaculum claviforme TaxID=1549854 RepID=A0A934TMM3_9RHOB|nr:N-acetylmuramidase domain-containing protein [Rhodobaculum claviforme]MBK5928585.1 hypothetical protein [Rhodobaculum claviforme]
MTHPWTGAAHPRALTDADFSEAARRLGCEAAALHAIWEVEAAGRHFDADGGVVRRFEPHHFPRRHWPALGFAPRANEAPWRASLRLSDAAMFRRAVRIDPEAACRATSWGAPQIMGFNHADAGFDSAAEMVAHMARGAPQQLGAFVQLIEGWGLGPALRAHDWTSFARRYNGTGQIDTYARRIEAAWRRHAGGARSPVVLRVGDRGAGVVRLQAALGIAEDGAFGPETLAAVRALQHRAGLSVDGVVGAQTWAALARGSATPPPPVQPTPADAVIEQVKDWSAATGAVAAALAAVSQALPPDAVTVLMVGAVGLGLMAAAAWLLRRVRA